MPNSNPSAPLVNFNFPVVISWPVQWGDQDAFSHVNNTVYFRWFESGRIAYFERLGLAHTLSDGGLGPMLAAINCQFHRRIGYQDAAHMVSRISTYGA